MYFYLPKLADFDCAAVITLCYPQKLLLEQKSELTELRHALEKESLLRQEDRSAVEQLTQVRAFLKSESFLLSIKICI